MKAFLSPQRVDSILFILQHLRKQIKLPFRAVFRLMGVLAAAALIPLGLLSMSPYQRWVNSLHLNSTWHRSRLVKVTEQYFLTLTQWKKRSFLMKGVALGVIPSRREIIQTDASLSGCGVVWQHSMIRGLWKPEQATKDINTLELQAVQLALKHFVQALKNRHILIRTDNTSVVYHINHQGGTRSSQSLRVAQDLLTWAFPRFASVRAMHIPGVLNVMADFLSRHRPLP